MRTIHDVVQKLYSLLLLTQVSYIKVSDTFSACTYNKRLGDTTTVSEGDTVYYMLECRNRQTTRT